MLVSSQSSRGWPLMKIYILDDQVELLTKIKTALLQLAVENNWPITVKVFTNIFTLEDTVFEQGQYADIYFLDLDKSGIKMGGITFAKRLRESDVDATISFISKFPMLMSCLFANHLGAYDFIDKTQLALPLMADLKHTITYRQRQLMQRNQPAKLIINNIEQSFLLAANEIIYVETTSIPHQLRLVTLQQEILFYDQLGDLQQRLPQFIRCHRSYLINPQYVTAINRRERLITLINDIQIPVARNMVAKLCENITNNDDIITV